MAVIDNHGTDITMLTADAAAAAGIPPLLLVGCMIAESEGMDPQAERWGRRTAEARSAITDGDHGALQAIIDEAWPDISFGRSQRIVKFHWTGDGQPTVANCLAVRQAVFADPARDAREMAGRLAANLRTAQQRDLTPVQGSELLGACVVYNAGHWPVDGAEWQSRTSVVHRYRESLARAQTLMGIGPGPGGTGHGNGQGDVPMTAIERRAKEFTIGELGPAQSAEIELGGGVRVKAYMNAVLLEIPGAGVYALAEATVLDKFR